MGLRVGVWGWEGGWSGAYIALDVHELVAVVSCFVPCDKSKEEGRLARELEEPLQLLRNTARRVAEVGRNGRGGGVGLVG